MGKGGFKGRKTLVTGDGEHFCPPFTLLPPGFLPHVMTLPATPSWNSKSEACLSFVFPLPCHTYIIICSHLWNLTCVFSQIRLLYSTSQPHLSCLSASAKRFPYLKCLHFHLMSLDSVFLCIPHKMSPPLRSLPLCPALCTEHEITSYWALIIYWVSEAGTLF